MKTKYRSRAEREKLTEIEEVQRRWRERLDVSRPALEAHRVRWLRRMERKQEHPNERSSRWTA